MHFCRMGQFCCGWSLAGEHSYDSINNIIFITSSSTWFPWKQNCLCRSHVNQTFCGVLTFFAMTYESLLYHAIFPLFSSLGWCHAPIWSNSQTCRHRTILSRSTISNEEIMGGSGSAAVLQEIQWISTQRFSTIVSLIRSKGEGIRRVSEELKGRREREREGE